MSKEQKHAAPVLVPVIGGAEDGALGGSVAPTTAAK